MSDQNRIRLPPLGETHLKERVCLRQIGRDDQGEILCLKPATVHIAWENTSPIVPGWACEEHAQELTRRWSPWQMHPIGPDCGMPGSRWMPEENRCRCDGEIELEPAEFVKAVAA